MSVIVDPCDALTELVNIGIGRAAAALNSLCGERIELAIPRVEVGKAGQLGQFLPAAEEPLETFVVQDFRGGLFGRAVLALPRSSRDKLGALLGYFAPRSELAEADRDGIVIEVGNLVLNAVLGAIANCLHVSVVCSVPELAAETDLRTLMAGHESVGKRGEPGVFVAHALFRVANQSLPGAVVAIFELDTIAKLLASLSA